MDAPPGHFIALQAFNALKETILEYEAFFLKKLWTHVHFWGH